MYTYDFDSLGKYLVLVGGVMQPDLSRGPGSRKE